MTLLSAKYRNAHPFAQVQSLRRIGVRATKKADWIEWEAPRAPHYELSDYELEEVARWRARAKAATQEIIEVVRANPDLKWTLRQRHAAGIAVA